MKSVLDDLPIRPVGEWAYDKIYRLVQYFGIFAGGMKNRWAALNYVEIGCGPGRRLLRENCLEIDGTALATIRSPNFSSVAKSNFHRCQLARGRDSLTARIGALGAGSIASAVVGDYSNGAGLCGILKGLPEGSLNFIFIDPTECDVPFETIEQIVRHLKNTDLLVNVALGTDANRNLVSAILLPSHVKVREKYELFSASRGSAPNLK